MEMRRYQRRARWMSEGHTPSKFKVDPEDACLIATADGEFYAFAGRRFDTAPENRVAEQHANAERIAACLNACVGIPTSMLQQMGCVDDLYEALTGIRRWLELNRVRPNPDRMKQINDAIANMAPAREEALQQKIDIAKRTLSDANIQDDTTPMYDVADLKSDESDVKVFLGSLKTVDGSFPPKLLDDGSTQGDGECPIP